MRHNSKYRLRTFLLIPLAIWLSFQLFTIDTIHQWNSNTLLNISHYLNKTQTLIFPRNLNEKYQILAVVTSAPDNFDNRFAIRQTWKNQLEQKNERYKVIFHVGLHPKSHSINLQVNQEANHFGDVLLQDFTEHYTNLSVKSALILKFTHQDLNPNPDFLLKVH